MFVTRASANLSRVLYTNQSCVHLTAVFVQLTVLCIITTEFVVMRACVAVQCNESVECISVRNFVLVASSISCFLLVAAVLSPDNL